MWLIIGCISVLSPTLVCLLQGILRIEPHERETVQRADLRASQRKAASTRAKAARETVARDDEQVGLLGACASPHAGLWPVGADWEAHVALALTRAAAAGRADGSEEVEEAEEIMDLPAGFVGSDPSSNEGADGAHDVAAQGRIN